MKGYCRMPFQSNRKRRLIVAILLKLKSADAQQLDLIFRFVRSFMG